MENKHVDIKGGKMGRSGMNWEIGIDRYKLLIVCIKYSYLMRPYCRAQGPVLSAL